MCKIKRIEYCTMQMKPITMMEININMKKSKTENEIETCNCVKKEN